MDFHIHTNSTLTRLYSIANLKWSIRILCGHSTILYAGRLWKLGKCCTQSINASMFLNIARLQFKFNFNDPKFAKFTYLLKIIWKHIFWTLKKRIYDNKSEDFFCRKNKLIPKIILKLNISSKKSVYMQPKSMYYTISITGCYPTYAKTVIR